MSEITILVIDNSYYAQNQDYLPTRYIVQTDVLTHLLSTTSDNHQFGVIPIGQPSSNYILTPTKNRMKIRQFLSTLALVEEYKAVQGIYSALKSFQYVNATKKRLIAFLSSPLTDFELENFLMGLRDCALFDCKIFLFLFGDAQDYKTFLDFELKSLGVNIVVIDSEYDFKNKVLDVLGGNNYDEMDDPEMALAMKLSMEEANKQKNNQ